MSGQKGGFQRWQVGDVRVTSIIEMETTVSCIPENGLIPSATPEGLRRHPWLYPHFVNQADELLFAIQALIVEAPGKTLVVDTCIGNDKNRAALGTMLATSFLQDIERAGFARDRIDAVICTHLHFDHIGWNTMLVEGRWVPTFPQARYLFGRLEYDHWTAHGDEHDRVHFADSVLPVVEAGLVDLVEMDHCICDEIRLVPTPGHTPGHVSVMIESRGQRAVITGDMAHHPCQMAEPDWYTPFDSDPEAAASTRRTAFKQWAREEMLVIGTHFAAPTVGRIRHEGQAFRLDPPVG
jgi:glyoxylase-like metal-dependent hydrolase (beta-lactamase superfamily II)